MEGLKWVVACSQLPLALNALAAAIWSFGVEIKPEYLWWPWVVWFLIIIFFMVLMVIAEQ